jgi:phospholipase/carboxylesterase
MPDHIEGFSYQFVSGTRALTVVALHGTGGSESDLLPLAAAVAPGAAVVSPRGRVLERGMARFFRRHAEGVFDEESIRSEALALKGFLTAAGIRHALAGQPRVALGYSNGANIAAALLLLHPGTLDGALLLRPMLPLLPEARLDLAGVPVFMAAGAQDPIVPSASVEALADVLRRAGADVPLAWQEASHGLIRPDLTAAAQWLATRFPATDAPA